MFKTKYSKTLKKIDIHWSAAGIDRLNGADAFDEIDGTKQMYCFNFLTD